jgi:hydrogenase nickel incorporation protein HypB
MFRKADLVLVTKIDLLPYLPDVRLENIADALARVMPSPKMLPLSARTGEGMRAWLSWLAACGESSRRRDLSPEHSAAPHLG